MNRSFRVKASHNSRSSQLAFKRVGGLLLGIAFAAAPVLAPAQISLGTVVDQAQRNSSAVKLADADVLKAEASLAETRDVFVPNFVIGSSIGPPSIGFPTGQPSVANATMQAVAYSVPQGQYIKAARIGIQAATLRLKDAKEQVALDASTAYIELDVATRELEAARRQQAFADRLIDIEQQRTDAGVDPLSELLQVKLTAAQLKLKFIHLQVRATSLASQLASLTGLPKATIAPDHASIPEIPAIHADTIAVTISGIDSAQAEAQSKLFVARGDESATRIWPQIAFEAQYNRDATSLNSLKTYYKFVKADNFSAGFSIQIPLFDLSHRAKAQESAADALRAKAEAEQAQRQNDVQIASLNGNLRELDALAEIANLKKQIASEQLRTVQAELQTGNGAGAEPGAQQQLSPKAEQQARIDESQKSIDALDAEFDLNKTRLSLLRALGHMEDWLHELQLPEPVAVTK